MIDQASRLRTLMTGSTAVAAPISVAPAMIDTCVVAVTSGKGGVGKTTVAVNLGLLLAERGCRTLIVDADLGLANVDVMLGLELPRHIGHLLLTDCAPEDVALEGPLGCAVISGGSGLRELADADHFQRRQLLDKLRAYYAHFDYVIVDTSPGIGGEVVDFLADAHHILVVTTPEPTSLRDTYAAVKTIHTSLPEASVELVVNTTASDASAEGAVKALNLVTEKFLDCRIDNWFRVESDPMITRAISERRPAAISYPRSPAIASLRRLAKSLAESCRTQNSELRTQN